jgi:transposase
MAKPLSTDLRERAISRVEAGGSVRAVAASLSISPSCVVKWSQRFRAVRRQSIWDRRRRDLVEDAAHLTADFKRRSFGVASGDFGLCLV